MEMERISEQTRIISVPTMVSISEAATNLDPTGMLLDKQTQMIATVNINDFEDLVTALGNEEIASQYIEMICGKPLEGAEHAELRESFISSPTGPRNRFKYFENSWTNNSWNKLSSDIKSGKIRIGSLFNEVPAVFWTKNTHKSDPFSDPYDELLLTLKKMGYEEMSKRFVRLEYDSIIGVSTTSKLLTIFEDFLDTNWNAPEVHIWIQGKYIENGKEYTSSKVIDLLSVKVREAYKQEMPPSIVDLSLVEDVMYWSEKWNMSAKDVQSGMTAARQNYISYWYGEVRVPISVKSKVIYPKACIPFRVNKYNILERKEEPYAQMYPQTNIKSLFNEEDKKIYVSLLNKMVKKMSDVIFTNYSKHVSIERARNDMNYDFVYKMIGPGKFKVTMHDKLSDEPSYVIANMDFFMGTGSVITTHHRIYALARDEESLIRQYNLKLVDGVSTSGHMIAAQLSYTPHLLWYLHEILYNTRMKKSVYILSVNEPTEDIYHSKVEYMRAFSEINLTYAERSKSSLSASITPLNVQISRLVISQLV